MFLFQASLYAVSVAGFECQHITGDHFRDVLCWLKPSITTKDLQPFLVKHDTL